MRLEHLVALSTTYVSTKIQTWNERTTRVCRKLAKSKGRSDVSALDVVPAGAKRLYVSTFENSSNQLLIQCPVRSSLWRSLRSMSGVFQTSLPLLLQDSPTSGILRKYMRVIPMPFDISHWRKRYRGYGAEFNPSYRRTDYEVAFRWKDDSPSLCPQLEYIFDLLKWIYYLFTTRFVNGLDDWPSQERDARMTLWLNKFYEIICVMKHFSRIDQSVRDNIKSALAHQMLQVYLKLLPGTSSWYKSPRAITVALERDLGRDIEESRKRSLEGVVC